MSTKYHAPVSSLIDPVVNSCSIAKASRSLFHIKSMWIECGICVGCGSEFRRGFANLLKTTSVIESSTLTEKNMSSELAQQNHPSSRLSNGQKRSITVPEETKYVWRVLFEDGRMGIDESLYSAIPLNDQNAWYYPSQGHDDSEDEFLDVGTKGGNWGKKTSRGSRWVRRGKIVSWGPGMDEWEVQQLLLYESLR
jgi:hypothetical protein